jgi:hypothetical protein
VALEGSVASPSPTSLIEQYFPEEKEIAKAVAMAESGLRADAMGWNCYYAGKSQSCRPEDRGQAWSVDCGLFQINVIGKTCPQELYDISTNLKEARAKYDKRNWQPWYAYTSGKYLAHM